MNTLKLTLLLLTSIIALGAVEIQAQHGDQASSGTILDALQVHHNQSLHQMRAVWTDQNNRELTLGDFEGRPVMVVMFYGQCTGTRPVLSHRTWGRYQELTDSMREQVSVLAVSFDYRNDTPEALKEYAVHEKLDLPNWHFVTAGQTQIRELAMLLGVQYRERSDGHYEHSNLITVLDDAGHITIRDEGLKGDLAALALQLDSMFSSKLP